MRPVLLTVGGRPVHSYAFFLYAGLVVGVSVGNIVARRLGLDSVAVFWATIILMFPALLGSRLAFVAGNWRYFRRHPNEILKARLGGAAMLGGFVLTLIVSVPVVSVMGLEYLAYWDVGVLTILTGMVPTRIGCLLAGCCAGRPSDGIVAVPLRNRRGEVERRIPMQVIEGLVGLLLVVSLLGAVGRVETGVVFLSAMAGYGLARLILDAWREERSLLVWKLSGSQLAAGSLVVLAVSGVGLL